MIIHKLSEKMIGEWRMKRLISKILAGIGITIVAIPVLLIALFVVIEVVGNVANHAATIVDSHSFTGNISGSGNHVECESMVTFNSDMAEDEVDRIFDAKYEYRELEKTDGSYIITVYGDAPFPDNLEGH